MFQPLVSPTSMYSMKRRSTSFSRAHRASGRISPSFMPRWITAFTLTGSPKFFAAMIPETTRSTLAPVPFILAKIAESRASSETVTRFIPASASSSAWWARSTPLVVMARSFTPLIAAIIATRSASPRLSSGSPPVSLTFSTPRGTRMPTRRTISSKLSSSSFGKNEYPGPKTSTGMQ